MNYLVSELTWEAVSVFFFLGALFSVVHGLVFALLSLPSIVRATYRAIIRRDTATKTTSLEEVKQKDSSHDLIRALIIFIAGIVFIFTVYALCDGIPRLYCFAFLVLGFVVTHQPCTFVTRTLAIHMGILSDARKIADRFAKNNKVREKSTKKSI